MNQNNLNDIEECLKGRDCRGCTTCTAEKEAWNKLDKKFAELNTDFSTELERYYQVKGKRTIFEQTQKCSYLTLSEAEETIMLSRY